jgi:cytochrome c oxidase subunit 2
MHNNQSSYSRWSWIIALILALFLLWMLLTGKGPSNACCNTTSEQAAPVPIDEPSAVTEAFSFSATADGFIGTGDTSDIGWTNDIDALKALLSDNFKAEGDDRFIVLTGTVGSEEAKQQKGLDAQAFFGPDITIDNQITVVMAEPEAATPPTAN